MGKVLIVDDCDFDRLMISRALVKKRNNIEIYEADSGADALEKVTKLLPDLIVLDVRMPGMDGFEVLLELRRDPELSKRPVVMLSGSGDDKDKKMAASCGANAYFVKPSNVQSYYEIAERLSAEYLCAA